MSDSSEPIELTILTRRYGDTHIARCCGQVASCTSAPETAAERAARKHVTRLAGLTDSEMTCLSITKISDGCYVAHAVLRRITPRVIAADPGAARADGTLREATSPSRPNQTKSEQ